jgi:hypothetical protein
MKTVLSAVCAAAIMAGAQAAAAPITVDSYSYVTGPGGSYPDSTGSELTDGVVETISFSDGVWTRPSQAFNYVGWQNRSAIIDFTFAALEQINSIEVSFDDADSAAGVDHISSLTIQTSDGAGGFSPFASFTIADLAGTGTNSLVFNTSGLSSDLVRLTFTGANQWIMLSEIAFSSAAASSVPVPAAGLLFGGAITAGVIRRKRRGA